MYSYWCSRISESTFEKMYLCTKYFVLKYILCTQVHTLYLSTYFVLKYILCPQVHTLYSSTENYTSMQVMQVNARLISQVNQSVNQTKSTR